MENTLSAQPPKLVDQIRNKLRVKHYAIRTEEQYLHWIKRYILFHGKRHPKDMGAAQIEAFLNQLSRGRQGVGFDADCLRHHVALTRNGESTPKQAGLRQRVARRGAWILDLAGMPALI